MLIRQEYKTVTIYEVYKGSKCIGKGTVVELSEKFGKNKTTIYGWGRQSKKPIVELVDHNITYAIKVGKRRVKLMYIAKVVPDSNLKRRSLRNLRKNSERLKVKKIGGYVVISERKWQSKTQEKKN